MKKHHKRLLTIVYIGIALSTATAIALFALQDNVSFFYSPTMLAEGKTNLNRPFRLGGLVVTGSLIENTDKEHYRFTLEDGLHTADVIYSGPLPSLFRDGQGIIAEGQLNDEGIFVARRILAKHDENYMPPEIKKTIHIPADVITESYQ